MPTVSQLCLDLPEAEPAPLSVQEPARGQRETRPCAACGVPVTRRLSQRKTAQLWTCSKTCQAKATVQRRIAEGTWKRPEKPRRGVETLCPVCGKIVYRAKAERAAGIGKYCSRACHNIAQTKEPIVKNCASCGVELRLKPSQAARQHCSKLCEANSRIAHPLGRTHNGRPARLAYHGYVLIWEPDHPAKGVKGWHFEHRIVAEKTLGRYLTSEEQVHHRNGDKADNRPENLQVVSAVEHTTLAMRELKGKLDQLEEYRRRFGDLT